jgi:hypothetical protein
VEEARERERAVRSMEKKRNINGQREREGELDKEK